MTTVQDVAFTYCCGLITTMGSAPLIHPFNVVAAAAAKTQQTSGKAALSVYHGLGSSRHDSIRNYWNGLAGHCSKEFVRSWGRIGGVVYVEKDFKERFSPAMAPHMLACVMATYEVIFANPADVWKSYRSTGMSTQGSDLFKGSIGNFARQYGMWFVWSNTTPIITAKLQQQQIDPKSVQGVAMRSFAQAVACTVVTYPLELVLRTVQVRAADYPVKGAVETAKFALMTFLAPHPPTFCKKSAYCCVISDLMYVNGFRGLGLGMTAKLLGNTALLMNANYLPMVSDIAKRRGLFSSSSLTPAAGVATTSQAKMK